MRKFLLFFGLLSHAFACESVYVPPCEVGRYSGRIFIGTALGPNPEFGPYRFRIDEPLKGIPADLQEIEVGPGPCGSSYPPGEQFLVLATNTGPLSSSQGEPINQASKSIAHFRALSRGEHRHIIQGQVAANVEDSMVNYELENEREGFLPGVEITAVSVGDGSRYTAVTDSTSSFSIAVPNAGRYTLSAKLAKYSASDPSYTVEVAPDSCAEVNIGMWTASRLAGYLTGSDGKPLPGITIDLQPSDEDDPSPFQTKTDTTGKFEFEKIPSGTYVVGVNTTGLDSKLPYDPRYYPGVPFKPAATVVNISGAQTIDGLDFRLAPRKPLRRITVNVAWPDGRPVTNARVFCLSTYADPSALQRDGVSRYVDLNGEASCEVLADQNYSVEVDRLSWEHSGRPVLPINTRMKISVVAGTILVPLRFVLDPVNDISATEKPSNMAEFNDREIPSRR